MFRTFYVSAVFCVACFAGVVGAKAEIVSTDATWRAIGPVGNLEGQPIDSVGLAWEASQVGWNTALEFDDSEVAGWKSPYVYYPNDSYLWSDTLASTPSYFRKKFTIDGTPTSGSLYVITDDDSKVWVNGTLVVNDVSGVLSEHTVDVASVLREGENLIAVKAHDSFGEEQYFALCLNFASVPEPSTFILSGIAALGLLAYTWRRRRS